MTVMWIVFPLLVSVRAIQSPQLGLFQVAPEYAATKGNIGEMVEYPVLVINPFDPSLQATVVKLSPEEYS